MSVKYTTQIPQFKADTAITLSLAIRFMLDGVDDIANPKTPKDKGNLRRDTIKRVLGAQGIIIWNKEYASYQEDKQYSNYTTPGTGPHYAENAVEDVVENAEQYFRKARMI